MNTVDDTVACWLEAIRLQAGQKLQELHSYWRKHECDLLSPNKNTNG